MAGVGAITVDTMTGTPEPFGDELEEFDRVGVDGSAFFVKGLRSKPKTIMTTQTFKQTTASVKVTLETYMALRGTIVSVVDSHGVTWSNVIVLDVDPVALPIAAVSGGSVSDADRICNCTWTVKLVGSN